MFSLPKSCGLVPHLYSYAWWRWLDGVRRSNINTCFTEKWEHTVMQYFQLNKHGDGLFTLALTNWRKKWCISPAAFNPAALKCFHVISLFTTVFVLMVLLMRFSNYHYQVYIITDQSIIDNPISVFCSTPAQYFDAQQDRKCAWCILSTGTYRNALVFYRWVQMRESIGHPLACHLSSSP